MKLINKVINLVNNIKELTKIVGFGNDVLINNTNYKFVDLKDYGYSKLSGNYNSFIKNKDIEEVEIELDISNLFIDGSKVDDLKMEETNESDNEYDTYLQTLDNNLIELEENIKLYCNFEFEKINLKINDLDVIKNKKILDSENK